VVSITVEGGVMSLRPSEKGMGCGGGMLIALEGEIVSLRPSEKGMGGGGTNSLSGELMAG
jgi:hypothetical protein